MHTWRHEVETCVVEPSGMDDDIDVFAELGVTPTAAPATGGGDEDLLGLLAEAPSAPTADPLAALMDGDEDGFETAQGAVEATPAAEPAPAPEPSQPIPDAQAAPALSEEMIGQVVALLVQRGLSVDPRRLGLPADTGLDVGHVTVERDQDLLVARADVTLNGTPMHPFAAVRLTEEGLASLSPPDALPEAWHPMHDVLATALMEGSQQLEQALGRAWVRA